MRQMASRRSVVREIKAQTRILRSQLEQRRCGKTWKRLVVEFGESVHFRPVGENNALRVGDQRMLRGVHVGHHERSSARDLYHARRCEKANENCKNVGAREMGSRVQCNMYRSSMAVEARSAESGETCRTCGRGRSKVLHLFRELIGGDTSRM